jgi:pepF/M3 family oligoendopeptidase
MTTTTSILPPAPTWDLDAIFPGGSGSKEFAAYRADVKNDIAAAWKLIAGLPEPLTAQSAPAWTEAILAFQNLIEKIELVQSFAHCLVSQNVADSAAHTIEGEGDIFISEWEKMRTALEAGAIKADDKAWADLVSGEKLVEIKFFLNELREQGREKMSPELESLALDLSVNGIHAWNRLYDKMAADLMVEFDDHGTTKPLSLGQLATKMADPNRETRKQAFEQLETAWDTRADLAAMTLNALGGFRLTLYKNRGWDSHLHESLQGARLKKETLDTMWRIVEANVPKLRKYIDAKKKLLGMDSNRWYDQFAPCGTVDKLYSYDQAAKFIIENKGSFSSDMAEFSKRAIERRWIEAEDRAGKMGGGYCTGMGPKRETRIFMTYANSYENLLTLAHELGHAYHSWVLKDKAYFSTAYPMTLAETASIFAELLVTDAALQTVTDPREKLMLLDQKLQQPYIMFCNIYCRYLFEDSFYTERKHGIVGRERLNELMLAAQKRAYGNLLDADGYHKYFWCSKLHFFISERAFYNFPYTFGYLFAGGVYDRARKEGKSFADKYRALLTDTGSMTTEQVAQKHLGVDLTKDQFWTDAVSRSLADVDEFVRLAEQLG